MAQCATCGVKVEGDGHRFTDDEHLSEGATKIKLQYCDGCCPRCNQSVTTEEFEEFITLRPGSYIQIPGTGPGADGEHALHAEFKAVNETIVLYRKKASS